MSSATLKDKKQEVFDNPEPVKTKSRSLLWLFAILTLLPVGLIGVLFYFARQPSGLKSSFVSGNHPFRASSSPVSGGVETRLEQIKTTVGGWSTLKKVAALSLTILAVVAVVASILYAVYSSGTLTRKKSLLEDDTVDASQQQKEDGGLTALDIAGIVIGGTVLFGIVAGLIFWFKKSHVNSPDTITGGQGSLGLKSPENDSNSASDDRARALLNDIESELHDFEQDVEKKRKLEELKENVLNGLKAELEILVKSYSELLEKAKEQSKLLQDNYQSDRFIADLEELKKLNNQLNVMSDKIRVIKTKLQFGTIQEEEDSN